MGHDAFVTQRHQSVWRLAIRLGGLWLAAACSACGELEDEELLGPMCAPDACGLVITEVMPAPRGDGSEQPWVELSNHGKKPVALNRMMLSVGGLMAPSQHTLRGMPPLAAGHIIVVGGGTHALRPIDVAYESLRMPRESGIVALHCQGVRLAAVVYGAAGAKAQNACDALDGRVGARPAEAPAPFLCAEAPVPKPGASLSLDHNADGRAIWHQSVGPTYDGYNVGTPQAANVGLVVCQDASGIWRPVRPPKPGELLISAVYADPPGRDDGYEWLSLSLQTDQARDVYGLLVRAQVAGKAPRHWALQGRSCWPIRAGEERVVRLMTRRAPAAAQRQASDLGDPVLFGKSLPNQAMQLAVGFDHQGPTPSDVQWCDVLDVPKPRPGVVFVRGGPSNAPPVWPALRPLIKPAVAAAPPR